MTDQQDDLQVKQVNCFYNYTIGLDVIHVDLLKTAAKLLKSGLVNAVCFSDLKAVFLDENGKSQVEWIRPQGRRWDSSWKVNFSKTLPKDVAADLVHCLELSFHGEYKKICVSGILPMYLKGMKNASIRPAYRPVIS